MKTIVNNSVRLALVVAVLTCTLPLAYGQAIFAHNDYVKPDPFYKAFGLKVEYIEADIFLEDGKLLVAHTKSEIDPSKTLESMYLKPIKEKITELYGFHLMIDLKTEGRSTLGALVEQLQKYPELINNDKLFVVISGSYPPPSEWKNYPSYIWFDGRPNVTYSNEQVQRLKLVSTSFPSKWNGQGEIPGKDLEKMKESIAFAHKLNKPMRFWASPDFENAWVKLTEAGVDILNSDNIEQLSKFIPTLRSGSQRSR